MSLLLYQEITKQLEELHGEGLYKNERVLSSPQQAAVRLEEGREVLNFCANNYLGLSNHPDLISAAQEALGEFGFGLSSVRFICGTQTVHKQLESRLSEFLGMEDTILYSSCFDANTGLYETLLGPEDAIISDELNHASIIDGIRLCKATKYRYRNGDMNDLEKQLKACKSARFRMIATDGVFSMDGTIANLGTICDLADKHQAIVMVDDSHAVGVLGKSGRGTHEYCKVMGRVDIITGTFGKALGGASGGYTSGRHEIISLLRQRSRPYLFSNSLAPVIVKSSITVLKMLSTNNDLIKQLNKNTTYFRKHIQKMGFTIKKGVHPIVPIMIGDARIAQEFSEKLLDENIYVIGFSYPVVPKNGARIRVQLSASHSKKHIDKAIKAFIKVGNKHKII